MVRVKNKGFNVIESDYFENFIILFKCLIGLIFVKLESSKLVLDGVNGVGGLKMEVLIRLLSDIDVEICNIGRDGGVFNEGVGVDFV